jgi:hypothetical protein
MTELAAVECRRASEGAHWATALLFEMGGEVFMGSQAACLWTFLPWAL